MYAPQAAPATLGGRRRGCGSATPSPPSPVRTAVLCALILALLQAAACHPTSVDPRGGRSLPGSVLRLSPWPWARPYWPSPWSSPVALRRPVQSPWGSPMSLRRPASSSSWVYPAPLRAPPVWELPPLSAPLARRQTSGDEVVVLNVVRGPGSPAPLRYDLIPASAQPPASSSTPWARIASAGTPMYSLVETVQGAEHPRVVISRPAVTRMPLGAATAPQSTRYPFPQPATPPAPLGAEAEAAPATGAASGATAPPDWNTKEDPATPVSAALVPETTAFVTASQPSGVPTRPPPTSTTGDLSEIVFPGVVLGQTTPRPVTPRPTVTTGAAVTTEQQAVTTGYVTSTDRAATEQETVATEQAATSLGTVTSATVNTGSVTTYTDRPVTVQETVTTERAVTSGAVTTDSVTTYTDRPVTVQETVTTEQAVTSGAVTTDSVTTTTTVTASDPTTPSSGTVSTARDVTTEQTVTDAVTEAATSADQDATSHVTAELAVTEAVTVTAQDWTTAVATEAASTATPTTAVTTAPTTAITSTSAPPTSTKPPRPVFISIVHTAPEWNENLDTVEIEVNRRGAAGALVTTTEEAVGATETPLDAETPAEPWTTLSSHPDEVTTATFAIGSTASASDSAGTEATTPASTEAAPTTWEDVVTTASVPTEAPSTTSAFTTARVDTPAWPSTTAGAHTTAEAGTSAGPAEVYTAAPSEETTATSAEVYTATGGAGVYTTATPEEAYLTTGVYTDAAPEGTAVTSAGVYTAATPEQAYSTAGVYTTTTPDQAFSTAEVYTTTVTPTTAEAGAAPVWVGVNTAPAETVASAADTAQTGTSADPDAFSTVTPDSDVTAPVASTTPGPYAAAAYTTSNTADAPDDTSAPGDLYTDPPQDTTTTPAATEEVYSTTPVLTEAPTTELAWSTPLSFTTLFPQGFTVVTRPLPDALRATASPAPVPTSGPVQDFNYYDGVAFEDGASLGGSPADGYIPDYDGRSDDYDPDYFADSAFRLRPLRPPPPPGDTKGLEIASLVRETPPSPPRRSDVLPEDEDDDEDDGMGNDVGLPGTPSTAAPLTTTRSSYRDTFEGQMLRRMAPLVVRQLRMGHLSPEDTTRLKYIFGSVWHEVEAMARDAEAGRGRRNAAKRRRARVRRSSATAKYPHFTKWRADAARQRGRRPAHRHPAPAHHRRPQKPATRVKSAKRRRGRKDKHGHPHVKHPQHKAHAKKHAKTEDEALLLLLRPKRAAPAAAAARGHSRGRDEYDYDEVEEENDEDYMGDDSDYYEAEEEEEEEDEDEDGSDVEDVITVDSDDEYDDGLIPSHILDDNPSVMELHYRSRQAQGLSLSEDGHRDRRPGLVKDTKDNKDDEGMAMDGVEYEYY
ncbi:hypothetical protein ONE63_007704 [Megalurothrips usitatus]|uniref:Mucin-5AC-like n=1 Tax=Megalurothrips usitatus TaxID=439358 RepID=A0AAV7XNH6_9NEOP|nr:hypothetical protein ONE63_007704 [Megalurothrips usitatus]